MLWDIFYLWDFIYKTFLIHLQAMIKWYICMYVHIHAHNSSWAMNEEKLA